MAVGVAYPFSALDDKDQWKHAQKHPFRVSRELWQAWILDKKPRNDLKTCGVELYFGDEILPQLGKKDHHNFRHEIKGLGYNQSLVPQTTS